MKRLPEFDLVGSSVSDEIRRLILRYGTDKVREAIKEQTARPRGPRPMGDWSELLGVLREDARSWLEERDPFKNRSNYSIARDFAAKHPGHSSDATYDRIMRKLRDRRRYYTLVDAVWLSETDYPYSANLRAISAVQKIGIQHRAWSQMLEFREASLSDYVNKFGDPPANMTMQELLKEAARPLKPVRGSPGNVLQIILGNRLH